ncbi:hypothetical protein [Rhodobacter ferrooxidans]|uniref:EF-hand domain-containing protein n=1 Tax=Rhodobacter ferrooxidans TaxID=371731 RepID=C8RYL1_9RHOB|nr:hypothetical protein [Rhodobacter sp. SW2]EEW26199.1 hypothetical protein Rsw2DRAFT_0889 [Rhodobacter sp. SW2]
MTRLTFIAAVFGLSVAPALTADGFASIDANADGGVDQDELTKALAEKVLVTEG